MASERRYREDARFLLSQTLLAMVLDAENHLLNSEYRERRFDTPIAPHQ